MLYLAVLILLLQLYFLSKAIGKNLTCIFLDHGLLRKNEGNEVEEIFRNQFDINLIRVNCKDRFLNKLVGVTDPERKRKNYW